MNIRSLLISSVTALLTIVPLTSAASTPVSQLDCEGGSSGPFTITYGISGLGKKTTFEVKESVKVKKGRALIFRLKPKGNTPKMSDFKDAVVKIKGKAGSEWFTLIDGSYNGTADENHEIGICADTDVGTYEYEITVEGFGMLDPRVIVEP